MPQPRPFDADARELSNRLFVEATAILEDATVVALAGQRPRLTAAACASHARELRKLAADLVALADAALVIAGAATAGFRPRKRRPKPRR